MNRVDKENISALRQTISDLDSDLTDFDLLRWLHHYDNNFDVIVPKLRRNISLTNCSHFESFEVHDVVRRYYPAGTTGLSKSHDMLVAIRCMGRLDNQGIVQSMNCTDFFRSVFTEFLSMLAKIRAHEKIIERQVKLCNIMDFDRLHIDLKFLKFLTTTYKVVTDFFTENYGDMYGKFVAINVPNNVAHLWKLVQAVIPGKAAAKVVILGNNWKTEILKHVDADVLPVHWGGTMVDDNGDEMCRSMIVVPDKIPEDLYYQHTPEDLTVDGLECLRVKPGKAKFVTLFVDKVGTTLEWYFQVHGGYGFGVYYSADDEKSKNVECMEMVFPDFGFFPLGTAVPERGSIVCAKSGYYKLRFSNKPSWISTSTFHYKAWCH